MPKVQAWGPNHLAPALSILDWGRANKSTLLPVTRSAWSNYF